MVQIYNPYENFKRKRSKVKVVWILLIMFGIFSAILFKFMGWL